MEQQQQQQQQQQQVEPSFAVYLWPSGLLRPSSPSHALLQAAAACNERWGGLHVTLAGFAHDAVATNHYPGLAPTHGSPLEQTLRVAQSNAACAVGNMRPPIADSDTTTGTVAPSAAPDRAATPTTPTPWSCCNATWRCTPDQTLIVMLPAQDPVLGALAATLTAARLHQPRPAASMHLTLGPRPALQPHWPWGELPAPGAPAGPLPPPLAQDLSAASWDLLIVQSKTLDPLRVTEQRERLPLSFLHPTAQLLNPS